MTNEKGLELFSIRKVIQDGIENPETNGIYFIKMKGHEVVCERHKPSGCECGHEGLNET